MSFFTLYHRFLLAKQILMSPFVSMSFVTPLDYSVMNVEVTVAYQPAVMMYNAERTATMWHHSLVTQGLGLY